MVAGGALSGKSKPFGGGLFGKKKTGGKFGGLFGKKKGCKLLRNKRSINEIVSNATEIVFKNLSSGLARTGSGLKDLGNQIHRGSDFIQNASLTAHLAGSVASDRIRRGSPDPFNGAGQLLSDLARSLIRPRRAVRPSQSPKQKKSYRPMPKDFRFPNHKLNGAEMLNLVRKHGGVVSSKTNLRIYC